MANRWSNATDEQRQKFKEAVSKGKKKMRENFSKEERAKHIKQLKINAEKGRKNKSEESKRKFKEKMSKIVKERRENDEYRKHMSNIVSQQMKRQREGYSEEEKEKRRQDIRDVAQAYRESLDEEGRKEYINKMLQGRIAAAEEREKRGEIKRACQFPQCLAGAKAISKVNLEWEQIFINNGFTPVKEFPLGDYCYDFKIGDILVEINPYVYHNSTRTPNIPGAKIKDKMYHYNKAQNAFDKGYKLIMVWDWTTVDSVINCLQNDATGTLGEPRLHRYNYKTKEHLLDNGFDREEMINKGFVEIRDGGF